MQDSKIIVVLVPGSQDFFHLEKRKNKISKHKSSYDLSQKLQVIISIVFVL